MKKTLSLILVFALMLSLVSAIGVSAEEYYEDSSSWTITASCNQQWYGIEKAFDGNESTYWHSEYSKDGASTKHNPPHTITVEFPDKRDISGVTYVPRQKTEKDSSEAGIWQIVEVYTSEDGVNYTYNTKLVYDTVAVAQQRETATAALYAGGSFKAIRFKVSGVSGHGSAAEIKFIKSGAKNTANVGTVKGDGATEKDESKKETEAKEPAKTVITEAGTETSVGTVYVSCFQKGNEIIKAFDGNEKTYWHSEYSKDGVSTKHENPHMITVIFPEIREISGVTYVPRQKTEKDTSEAGIWQIVEVYTSEDGVKFTYNTKLVYDTVAVAQQRETATAALYAAGKFKAIRFKVSGVSGHGSAAEITFIESGAKNTANVGTVKGDGRTDTYSLKTETVGGEVSEGNSIISADKKKWTVSASCVQKWYEADKAFDGKENTYWHSNFSDESGASTKHDPPHSITAVFDAPITFGGIRYTPRQINGKDASDAGIAKVIEIYVTEDGNNFKHMVTAEFPTSIISSREYRDVAIPGGSYKGIMIKVTDGNGGYATAAEIDLLAKGALSDSDVTVKDADGKVVVQKTEEKKDDEAKTEEVDNFLSSSGWKAEASSVREGYAPYKVIDGKENSYWHSNYVAEGSNIVSRDSAPYNIDIIFDKEETFSGFMYQARHDGTSGICTSYETYASDSDDGEWYFLESGTMNTAFSTLIPASKSEKHYVGNITAKKFRFVITNGGNGYGTCAELKLFKAKDGSDTVKASGYEALYDKKGLSEINTKDGIATSNKPAYVNGPLKNVLDGRPETWWQTASNEKAPYTLNINLARVQEIAAIDVFPRQTKDFHGTWEEFSVYYSLDGENYEVMFENLSFEKNLDVKRIVLDTPVKAQYVEFRITKGYTDKASVGELKFYETVATMKKRTGGNNEKYVLKIDSPVISAVKEGVAEEKTLDVAPYIAGGSTLIPLRGLLEMMGAEITWIDEDQTIIIKKDGITITLQNRYNLVFVETGGKYGTVRYTLPQAPRIKDGRTFIPIRFISEHLGYNVEWNGETRQVTITK